MMSQAHPAGSEPGGPVRSVTIALPHRTRVQLEALQTLLQIPAGRVIEKSIDALLKSLPRNDTELINALATRALSKSVQAVPRRKGANHPSQGVMQGRTVTGKVFRYTGSLQTGLEVLFENSNPLKISRESVQRIRHEITKRKGPVLMGAIFSPLMEHSLGKAIKDEYQLSPITLSYVIPLLQEEGFCQTRKEGRNWYVDPTD